jgi:hypothetical protein
MGAFLSEFRKAVVAFGLVPAVLVVIGLLVPSKYSKALMVIGALWGVANALFAVREVTATVTAEEPTITYRSGVAAP